MPEITEARKYADFIRKKLVKSQIVDVNILKGRYKKKGPFLNYRKLKKNLPTTITKVATKGKMIYMKFNNGLYLVNTLGLMGGWTYLKNGSEKYEHSAIYKEYSKYGDPEAMKNYMKNSLNHLNFEIVTGDGILYYYDVLSYGTLKCVDNEHNMTKILHSLGPDIMDDSTTFDVFKNQILKKNNLEKAIGNVIVNQKTISGLGNYYRADVLYLARVNPFRLVETLSQQELKKIYQNAKALTWGAYSEKMATKKGIINDTTMLPQRYNRLFFVFWQDYDIYGNRVVKKELYDGSQKRFIYYVPAIQK